jgi:hypothetical protein
VATFSAVTRRHILQAIAEYDDRGAESFLGVYGFGRSMGYTLIYDGKTYDSKAILGVAHRYATGRLATSEEFSGGKVGAAAILRKHGFEVTEPASAPAARRPVQARSPRAGTRRSVAAEEPPAICPTCFMALPSTGVCDNCG